MTFSLAKIKDLFKNRTVRIVAICIAALLLLFAAYRVFVGSGRSKKDDGYTPTEREERLLVLINGIGGVESAKAMITEEDGVPVGVVIVFEGEDGFLTRMRLMEVAAAALNIERSAVVVYAAEA